MCRRGQGAKSELEDQIRYYRGEVGVAASFTTDAVLKQTPAVSFTANAILKDTIATGFSVDAFLSSATAFAFLVDAILQKTVTPSFSVDAFLSPEVPDAVQAPDERTVLVIKGPLAPVLT